MAKISDYISTNSRTPTLITTPDTRLGEQVAQKSEQRYQQDLSNSVTEARRAKAEADRQTILNNEINFQAKSKLESLQLDKENTILKAVDVLTGMNEGIRLKQEQTISKAFLLKEATQLEVDFKQFYQDALSKANPNSNELLEQTQAWINNRFKTIEDTAPSADALSKFSELGTEFKIKSLGQAVEGQIQLRNQFIISSAEDTINQLSSQARLDPFNTEPLQKLNTVKEFYSQAGLNVNQVNEQIKKASEAITISQINGLFDIGDLSSIKTLLSSKEVQTVLPKGKWDAIVNEVINVENKQIETSIKTQVVNDALINYQNNKLTGYEGKDEKEAINAAFLQFVNDSSNLDPISYINHVSQFIENTNSYLPDAAKKHFQSKISLTSDPQTAITNSILLNKLNSNTKTAHLLNSFDEKTKAEAKLIEALSQTSDPDSAVTQARKLVRDTFNVPGLIEERRKSFTKLLSSGILMDEKIKNFIDNPADGLSPWYKSDPISNDIVSFEAKELAQTYYELTGDQTVALELAKQNLLSRYQPSSINSKTLLPSGETLGTELVRNPPEKFFKSDIALEFFKSESTKQLVNLANKTNKIFDPETNTLTDNTTGEIIPIKITEVPYTTEFEIGSNYTTWQIVDARPGREWDVYSRFMIETNIDKQLIIEKETELFNIQNKALAEKAKRDKILKDSWGFFDPDLG